jgi:hypothetical protein
MSDPDLPNLPDLPDDLFHDPPWGSDLPEPKLSYTVVERTQRCGKAACACSDDPDARHGPYIYHVYTDYDGSRRWEYKRPVSNR